MNFSIRNIFFLMFLAVGICLSAENGKFVVALDAGHGGSDAGAVECKTKEKDLNLSVVLKLGRLIEDNISNAKVVYTRTNDKSLRLVDRSRAANDAKADLFISVHYNSVDAKVPQARREAALGTEVFVMSQDKLSSNSEAEKRENAVIMYEDDHEVYKSYERTAEMDILFGWEQFNHLEQSLEFAQLVVKHLVGEANRIPRDPSVKQGNMFVLNQTTMPSVLIEVDFISNPVVVAYSLTESGQMQLATAIYNAIVEYYNKNHCRAPLQPLKQLPVPNVDMSAFSVKPTVQMPDTDASDDQPQGANSNVSSSDRAGQGGQTESTNEQQSDDLDDAAGEIIEPESEPIPAVHYRVQIATGDRLLKPNDPFFKRTPGVEYYVERKIYKYTVGRFATEAEANAAMRELRKKFSGAFVVKMKDDKRIPN